MYYVIYVGAGKESRTENLIEQLIQKDLYRKCFYPVRHMKKKIHSEWKDIYERMIPGYLFVEADQEKIKEFYEAMRQIPAMMKMLGKENNEKSIDFVKVYPLTVKEEAWLKKVSGIPVDGQPNALPDGNPVVELSQVGFDLNDQVVILSGPLEEMKGQIKKINLHQRTAGVEVEFMGQKTIFYMGIELVAKDEGNDQIQE